MSKNTTILVNTNGEKTMLKANVENEKIKHKYYDFLKESQGYSDATISAIKKSIYRYEEFTGFEEYSKFSKKKAIEFKKWLEEKQDPKTKKQISITTCYHYLRNLKDFFKWLCYQPSYKSKINMTEVEFLRLPKEKARIAVAQKREHYPTFEQLKKVIATIKINNEIDLRDRALLSFTFLSGMRDSAIISLPIVAFNENTLQISQDPKLGVKTKFSKTINSVMFKFDDDMLGFVLDWVKHLKTENFFGNTDPMFPRNKVENAEGSKSFVSNSVEPMFWQSATSIRDIFKQRFEDADIEYFSPHTFRHLAVNTAISKCKNGHEIKAVSQNFGHEDVGTTMTTYGTLNNTQMNRLIANMDFSSSNNLNQADLLAKFQQFLNQQGQGSF
jgi:site-specific recombinase XerD